MEHVPAQSSRCARLTETVDGEIPCRGLQSPEFGIDMVIVYSKYSSLFRTLLVNALALRWEYTCRWEHGGNVYSNEGNNFLEEYSDDQEGNDSKCWVSYAGFGKDKTDFLMSSF
jgi:hypothetical protein